MASKVRTCAELIHAENREHLIRANVDEIIVRGESAGSLLAKSATSPGITDSIRMLINNQDENKLWRIPVPSKFLGRDCAALANRLREKSGALLLAVIREGMSREVAENLVSDVAWAHNELRRLKPKLQPDYQHRDGSDRVC